MSDILKEKKEFWIFITKEMPDSNGNEKIQIYTQNTITYCFYTQDKLEMCEKKPDIIVSENCLNFNRLFAKIFDKEEILETKKSEIFILCHDVPVEIMNKNDKKITIEKIVFKRDTIPKSFNVKEGYLFRHVDPSFCYQFISEAKKAAKDKAAEFPGYKRFVELRDGVEIKKKKYKQIETLLPTYIDLMGLKCCADDKGKECEFEEYLKKVKTVYEEKSDGEEETRLDIINEILGKSHPEISITKDNLNANIKLIKEKIESYQVEKNLGKAE